MNRRRSSWEPRVLGRLARGKRGNAAGTTGDVGPNESIRASVPFLHANAAPEQGDAVTMMLFHSAAEGAPRSAGIIQHLLEGVYKNTASQRLSC